jgi:CheY-like chemotaxis protein
MNLKSNESTYAPTVLLVEDDKTAGRYLRQQFHDHTSVGVVLATSIESGHRLSRQIQFDAVICDLYFEEGTYWAERELYDGVDLLAAIQGEQATIPGYFLSFFALDPHLRDKAKKKGVNPVAWLQKSFVPSKTTGNISSPWKQVEADLFHRQLKKNSHTVTTLDGDVSLALQLRHPIRTFIQELPDPELVVTHPIEAICTLYEGRARASAPSLGLLHDGLGDTVQEALDDLANTIVEQFDWLTSENLQTEHYAATVRSQLESKIQRSGK